MKGEKSSNHKVNRKYIIHMVLYTIFFMENQAPGLVPIKAEELHKKCRCREDIINLCRELGNK